MRICSPQLGLSPDATLGGEVYDRELLRAMAAAGAEVEILLPAGASCPEVPGWEITRLPLRRGYRWWLSNRLLVPHIGRLHRRRPFEVLRVHSLRFTGLAALRARRRYRLPVAVVAHFHHLEPDRWTDLVERRVAEEADLIVCSSSFSRRQLLDRLAVPATRIAVVPPGVTQRPAVRRIERSGADATLIHVGSLIARKRVDRWIAALAILRRSLPTARLVLVGSGGLEHDLRRQAERLGLADAVWFTGAVSEQQKHALLCAADVFVTASALEGFGLAAVEAMACGLPVVAARAGALPELLDGSEAGLLVDDADPRTLAAAVGSLLADRSRYDRLSRGALRRAREQPDWGAAARRMLELYAEVRARLPHREPTLVP